MNPFKNGDITAYGVYRGQTDAYLYFGSNQFHDGLELVNLVHVFDERLINHLFNTMKSRQFKNLYQKLTT